MNTVPTKLKAATVKHSFLDRGVVIADGATSHILADKRLLSAHGLAPAQNL